MVEFAIKRHDTGPSLNAVLTHDDNVAVDLTGATVKFHMKDAFEGTVLVDQPAVIVDSAAGKVRYDWDAADTAQAGCFPAEFEVTFSDGVIETFPNDENLTIIIAEDIA